jgi:hypothetical protein
VKRWQQFIPWAAEQASLPDLRLIPPLQARGKTPASSKNLVFNLRNSAAARLKIEAVANCGLVSSEQRQFSSAHQLTAVLPKQPLPQAWL